MADIIRIHPLNPEKRLVNKAVAAIQKGAVIAYPTDSSYALACRLGDKEAVDRIRQIRLLDEKHNFTLVCRDLSELSTFAIVDNKAFRFLKAYVPGPFTFLLPATREVPRRLQHPNRKTIGLRIPDHVIAQALLEGLNEPLMSTSLIIPDHEMPLVDADEIDEFLGKRIDLIIDGGYCGAEITTVIDLVEGTPKIIRQGRGAIARLH